MIRIQYIYHSGFLVETSRSYYLFDYYKGEIPEITSGKPVYVFASHSHGDHYRKRTFEKLVNQGVSAEKIHAILAMDILEKNYPEGVSVQKVEPHLTYELDNGCVVETLESTDLGVAFLLTTDDGVIYHAGDLNDWYWTGEPEEDNTRMTEKYRAEINRIAGRHIDVAMVPLDARQEENYDRGMKYFLEKTDSDKVYPMHYWERPEVMKQFVEEYPEYKEKICFSEEL